MINQKLPSELLLLVFEQCLPSNTQFYQPRSLDAPLLLCGVCRAWRDLALSTPTLWSAVHIEYEWNRKTTTLNTEIVKGLDQWISRSQDLPLRMQVRMLNVEEDEEEEATAAWTWERIRWERIHFKAHDFLFRHFSKSPVSRLSEFDLSFARHEPAFIDLDLSIFPALLRLKITATTSQMNFLFDSEYTTKIRHAHLVANFKPENLVLFTQRSPSLQELCVVFRRTIYYSTLFEGGPKFKIVTVKY